MVHLRPVSCRLHWKFRLLFHDKESQLQRVKSHFLSQGIILCETDRRSSVSCDNSARAPKVTELDVAHRILDDCNYFCSSFLDIWVTHLHRFSELTKTLLLFNDKIELTSSNRLIRGILKADSRWKKRASSIMLMNVYITLHLGWEGGKKIIRKCKASQLRPYFCQLG